MPGTGFKRGFKSECESLAATVRAEIGLGTREPLDPRALAAHLGIPVYPVSSLAGNSAVAAAIDYVRTTDPSVMSAMTIFPGWPRRHRVIIFNDANTPQRQNSDLAHELAHGLCLHEPRYAIAGGCRDYAKLEEDEAAWLSGCLLVPRDAALAVALSRTPIDRAAADYGVTNRMMSWRVNVTGAKAQATCPARPGAERTSPASATPGAAPSPHRASR
jgi:IrrE N-terminal-like domain